jgi:hypothetical protein
MEPNKSAMEQWESGVGLGRAWWAFAGAQNRKQIRELQRKGEHRGLQLSLEEDLMARISAGELQAFGFEGGSDAGPALIPQRYFWRTEEIDWENETVTSLGKKFYHVAIQGEREPEDAWTMAPEPVDLTLIHARFDSVDKTPPSESRPSDDRSDQERGQAEFGPVATELQKPRMGRPSVLPMVRRVVRELIDRNSFKRLSKKQIEAEVRDEAQKRFPDLFRGLGQPAKNTINKALNLEGWPQR